MARLSLLKSEIIDRLMVVFRDHGFEGASLARLSAATGLGRSSLYHYFPDGKDDMAAVVLKAAGERFAEEVLVPLRAPQPPRRRIEGASAGLLRFYDDGRNSCLTNLFSVGVAGNSFRAPLTRGLEAMEAAFAEVAIAGDIDAEEARLRAEDALVAIQGSLVLSRATGDGKVFRRIVAELPDRLLDKTA
jgi:TetR/AcrR family transcriptional repressor of lmrAB and yxaGH operons